MQLPQFLPVMATGLVFLGAHSTVFAQTMNEIPGLPSCAQTMAQGITLEGNCVMTDFTCVCNAPSLWSEFKMLVANTCSASDAQAAVAWGQSFCANISITVSGASSTATSGLTATTKGTAATATPKSDANGLVNMGNGAVMVAVMAVAMAFGL